MNRSHVIQMVELELDRATGLHGPMASPHEALAVIREEYLELEREIFHGDDGLKALDEAKQLAAMAIRFCIDCIKTPLDDREA